MCSSGQLCSGNGRPPSSYASDNANNSGSQYALCALGVGLVALGIVMIVWSVVPSNVPGNSSSGGGGGSGSSRARQRQRQRQGQHVVGGLRPGRGGRGHAAPVHLPGRAEQAAAAAGGPGGRRPVERPCDPGAGRGDGGDGRQARAPYEEAVGSGRYPAPPSLLP
ncbi:hypothetical protein ANANG_G00226060 [Anguilla anguilla]|uniref:Uncharacterized protein n=1 Tax=Anguilla anguilla TaxID=7936 RepID=A0A9D3LX83_ANGAN|nr:hypothetical protein ANANG_G00226060 [Anguilla anguilla]